MDKRIATLAILYLTVSLNRVWKLIEQFQDAQINELYVPGGPYNRKALL